MRNNFFRNSIAAGLLFAGMSFAGTDDTFLIRGVTVHPVTSAVVDNTSVLVKDGKIAEIGVKIVAPKGMKVIEGKGLHVFPGMIDSGTTLGLSEISSIRESVDTGELGVFNPQLRAEIAVNAASEHFPVVRANGITTVITLPAGGGRRGFGGGGGEDSPMITGQGALIHLDGWTWEEMDVRRMATMQLEFPQIRTIPARFAALAIDAGITIPGGGTAANARRNFEAQLKKLNLFFEDVRRYQKAKAAGAIGARLDLKLEAMLPVVEGKVPMAVSADREKNILEAVKWAESQKVKIVLMNVKEFGNTLATLKEKNIPVILGPTLALPEYEDDPYDAAFTRPSEVFKAGVKFAFGSFNNEFVRNLPYQASAAVGFGLPYDEALKAVTINAAEIWGIADQYGSIEKGKWADLMITDGDPLETRTQIKQVFIKGKAVDLGNKHQRLYEKYLARP